MTGGEGADRAQACLVYINTLMLQRVLAEPSWRARMSAEDHRAITPLIHAHVNPAGSSSTWTNGSTSNAQQKEGTIESQVLELKRQVAAAGDVLINAHSPSRCRPISERRWPGSTPPASTRSRIRSRPSGWASVPEPARGRRGPLRGNSWTS
jgi:hypothetical protein